MVCQVRLFVLSRLLSSLWVSRTGSASDWCALQEALYKFIDTIQYNTIYNTVWGCNYKSSLNHLYILQKRIVRIICGLRCCASTKLSFYELHLLTIDNINKYQILLFMFSFHNNLLPRSLHTNVASCLKTNSDTHFHFTRSSSHYRSHYARINVKLFSIFCTGPTLWNKLPADLKNSNSLVAFKHLLKNALIIPPWSIEH